MRLHPVLDTMAMVLASIVSLMAFQSTIAGPQDPPDEFDDPDGICFGERGCDEWECHTWGEGCYPCTADETIEFCGDSGGNGCTGELSVDCGKKLAGTCTLSLVCLVIQPGPGAEDCEGNSCTPW